MYDFEYVLKTFVFGSVLAFKINFPNALCNEINSVTIKKFKLK